MVIKISQLKANKQNWFEISDSSGVLYFAKAPWMDVRLPLNAENIRQLVMLDKNSNVVYKTEYSVLENALEEALPLKFLWAGEQRFGQYSVVGKDGSKGSFYSKQNGFFDGKYCIEDNGSTILGYTISKGDIEVVSFYENERQIAQITKPTAVKNNLDTYYLHLADYKNHLMPIFAFFTVFYDYQNHNNSGKFTAGQVKISHRYTFDKNNKYYNSNWIKSEFGASEAKRFKEEIKRHNTSVKRKVLKIVLIIVSVWIVTTVAFIALMINLLAPPEPIYGSEFAAIVEDMGYFTVRDGYTVTAHHDEYNVTFYTFDSERSAQHFYSTTVEGYKEMMTGSYGAAFMGYWSSLKKDGWFYYVCQVDNTVLWAEVPSEYSKEVKEIRKAIGY